MDTDLVYTKLLKYLEKYDAEFFATFQKFREAYNKSVLNELKTRIKKFDD